ncbi:MAG: ABC transporter permease [Actinomycetota bacterium]|nr:ABC transporter permease [Rubrobacteraceae bacterium]MBA3701251.1 ABC transporter permease [Rubrobacteraceae bacterium]MDQ3182916.1 ABC transporter permease [Actinomycetota bacterium]MDQ3303116.1 ABC transporter permease [Actinomycetota bacterium]MDQ3498063.1 ABC transporter permease [Actinomycetota bacterium]
MDKVELLYFDGCPGYRKAEQSLKDALSREGIRSRVELVAVNTDEEAGALKLPGSPTIRVNGRDLFPSSTGEREDWRLSCRVYATPEGLKDHPTGEMIQAALRRSPVRAPDASGEPCSRKGVQGEDAGAGAEDAWSSELFGVPFRTLLSREVNRFLKVWTQTLLSPLLTSALYVVVFGYGLGSRIREVEGVPYLQFILPGLILLSVITASYGNASTSLFDAKRERYIDDVLISPMTPLQMALAYVGGGVLRGMLVGAGTFVLAIPLAGLPAERPLLLLVAGLATSVAFASLGVVAGVLATRIDHIFFLSAIVLQPLTFLGGVFYSAEMLPAPLRVATYADPIFYAVDAFRFAAVGVSDVSPYPALAALGVFAVLAFWGTTELLRRGYKLRY